MGTVVQTEDQDTALETIQKAFQAGFADFAAIDNSPYFDSIRKNPQFQQMLTKNRKHPRLTIRLKIQG
jgi:hypothetical protein